MLKKQGNDLYNLTKRSTNEGVTKCSPPFLWIMLYHQEVTVCLCWESWAESIGWEGHKIIISTLKSLMEPKGQSRWPTWLRGWVGRQQLLLSLLHYVSKASRKPLFTMKMVVITRKQVTEGSPFRRALKHQIYIPEVQTSHLTDIYCTKNYGRNHTTECIYMHSGAGLFNLWAPAAAVVLQRTWGGLDRQSEHLRYGEIERLFNHTSFSLGFRMCLYPEMTLVV